MERSIQLWIDWQYKCQMGERDVQAMRIRATKYRRWNSYKIIRVLHSRTEIIETGDRVSLWNRIHREEMEQYEREKEAIKEANSEVATG